MITMETYSILYILITLLLGLLTFLIIYARWNYGTLENIKGLSSIIPPYFVFGSDPFFYKKVCCDEDTRRARKYGSVFGIYDGSKPQIYISDPDIIRKICVNDFSTFCNRGDFEAGHKWIDEMLDILPYGKCKVLRPHIESAFSPGKLPKMRSDMIQCVQNWVDTLQSRANKEPLVVDTIEIFNFIVAEIIAKCAFGADISMMHGPNKFSENLEVLSYEGEEIGFQVTLMQTFPFLSKLLHFFPSHVIDYFSNLLKTALERKTHPDAKPDVQDFISLIQSLMEKAKSDNVFKAAGLTETTAISQAFSFLVAGYQTLSGVLSTLAFRLATNPEKQAKLLEELSSSGLRSPSYLEACIKEAIRMNSPLIRIERCPIRDWIDPETGLQIMTGTVIQIPVYAVHYDPKSYPNPEEFMPERFLSETNDPPLFLGFGIGPRSCVGKDFAMDTLKAVMTELLKKFELHVPKTGAKLKVKAGRFFMNQYDKFAITLVPRNMKK